MLFKSDISGKVDWKMWNAGLNFALSMIIMTIIDVESWGFYRKCWNWVHLPFF